MNVGDSAVSYCDTKLVKRRDLLYKNKFYVMLEIPII
jgi:hypothetical protein